MSGKNLQEVVRLIQRNERRYEAGAYLMVQQALDYTLKRLHSDKGSKVQRHIRGDDLCRGIRDYMLEQYGPMAFALLKQWKVSTTLDFGEIVFVLVEYGIFSVTDEDKLEDFKDVYSFDEAFKHPFLPSSSNTHLIPLIE
jgi:uncharacterized repeat protein (TIGR04138 family)